ncbi:hypothetical protein RIF29_27545 [Crotalaria pallida]|uniref:XS domain-containing protein n=1 Tax=Crotalaria pallida TaxID=3830 RepID=A0AAN9EU50_CROPI
MRDQRNYRDTRRNASSRRPAPLRFEPDVSPVRRNQRHHQRSRYGEADRSSDARSRSVAARVDHQRSRYTEVERSRNAEEYSKRVEAATARGDQRYRYSYSEVDRSSDILQYTRSSASEAARGGEMELASATTMKFRWNNLLEAEKEEGNAKNNVSGYCFGYEIGARNENRGYLESGVVPIMDHIDRKNEVEFQIPKKWEKIHQHYQHHEPQNHHQPQQHHEHQHHQHEPIASSANYYFEENVHVHGGQMPKSNSIPEIPKKPCGYVPQQCSVPAMNREFNYSEMQGGMMMMTHDDVRDDEVPYRNMVPKGDFRDQEFRRPSIVDSIVDRIEGVPNSHGDSLRKRDRIDGVQSFHGDSLGKGVPWEQRFSSEQHSSPIYNDLSPKYHDLTMKTHNLSPKYHDLNPKYHDLTMKTHDLSPKYHDLSPKYHDLTMKTHDLSPKYHDLTPRSHDLSLKSPKYHNLTPKSCNLSPEYHNLTEKSHDSSPKYHDLTPKYNDLTQSHSSKQCVDEICGCRNMHPEYAYASNYQDSWKGLPVINHPDQCLYKQEEGNVSKTEEQAMREDLDVDMFELKPSGITTNENQVWTDFNAKQCASDSFDDEDISFDLEDIVDAVQFKERLPSPYSPLTAKKNSRTQHMVTGKSAKKKSKPGRIITFPNSLVSSCRNVHDRLGPRLVPSEIPYDERNIKSKTSKRNLHDFSKTATCSDVSDVKVKVKHVKRFKTEPPEDSKEFKQLVQNAFYKFVKVVNENPALRRKYTDQREAGTLRCTLCGSKSEEFANTHSLAMHAFNSTKAWCRAEHLGFHKALCLLLGWSDTACSDGLWVQKILPDAEASNLKNNLIIWPPVVLVHNSSIAHYDPDKRMVVSIERLEAILKGMGFGGGKTKVSRGKPGNFSILVVTFNATFSGLQEAERLHKFYADKQHGRAELQQIDDGRGLKDCENNEESALFGYLGNAEDLDKLDFESKKHSVVKSKKEIQAIADANLR